MQYVCNMKSPCGLLYRVICGVIDFGVRIDNQNITTVADAHADKKTLRHLSYFVAMGRQSLSRAKLFSILWPVRYRPSLWGIGTLRFFREGMHGVIPLSSRASRYHSASYPRSSSMCTREEGRSAVLARRCNRHVGSLSATCTTHVPRHS